MVSLSAIKNVCIRVIKSVFLNDCKVVTKNLTRNSTYSQDNTMIVGIISRGKELRGECKINKVINSHNEVITVICNGVSATTEDRIIYKCDCCGKEETNGKRGFFRKKRINCLCSSCSCKKTSLIKYGVESPNQSQLVKDKQFRLNRKQRAFTKREKLPKRTKEELASLRSLNAKELWRKGSYDKVDYSSIMKNSWQDPQKRSNLLAGMNNPERLKRRSEATKRLWLREDYRNKMSKISIRISKFQLDVYEFLDKNIWKMEYAIPNTVYTVDLCNPDTKEIIECYGDYWHCNPKLYEENFYHKRAHKTAKEIWTKNACRISGLEKLGYKVKIIWERDWKRGPRQLHESW